MTARTFCVDHVRDPDSDGGHVVVTLRPCESTGGVARLLTITTSLDEYRDLHPGMIVTVTIEDLA